MDIQGSGSISSVSSFTFTVPRYVATSGSRFDGWFSEFYPTYDGSTLISRECEVGVVWNTASNDTEITWLMRGKIVDYRFEPRKMIITILQSTEIDSRPLPYYSVQKDFDNEVSYFTNAPDENYGATLPIVYGDFTLTLEAATPFPPMGLIKPLLFPLVLVDKHKLTYVAGTHEFNNSGLEIGGGGSSQNWRFLSGLKEYMLLNCTNGSETDNVIKLTMNHFDSLNNSGNVIIGTIFLIPTLPGINNDISDYSNLTDLSSGTDTITVTSTNEVALTIDGSDTDIGLLSRAANSIVINVRQSDSVTADSSDDTILTYFNPEFGSGTGGYGDESSTAQFGWDTGDGNKQHQQDMTNDFVGRDISGEPWRWGELFNLEFIVRAISTYTNKYSNLWVTVQNIVVSDARKTVLVNPGQRK